MLQKSASTVLCRPAAIGDAMRSILVLFFYAVTAAVSAGIAQSLETPTFPSKEQCQNLYTICASKDHCSRYSKALTECAVAAHIDKCVEIKMGTGFPVSLAKPMCKVDGSFFMSEYNLSDAYCSWIRVVCR